MPPPPTETHTETLTDARAETGATALTVPARLCACLVALCAALSLAAQFRVASDALGGSAVQVVWHLARYFTLLTNALVALLFGWTALRGRPASGRLLAGLVLYIGAVGGIYHLLLAPLWEPQGLVWLADLGMHTVVPLAVAGWWLCFGAAARLEWPDPLIWLAWPAVYLAYALARGAADGVYPYPFIDLHRLSTVQLTWNVARIAEGFVAAGYLLVLLSRLRGR
jgi:hypothetical protein